ncbi:MAG: App1 family protein [Myxococcota bacterium]
MGGDEPGGGPRLEPLRPSPRIRRARPVLETLVGVQSGWSRVVSAWRDRFGYSRPIEIVPYRGWGTGGRVRMRGRVLGARDVGEDLDDRGALDNLSDMLKRYAAAKIPRARVRVRLGGHEVETRTDRNGYLDVVLQPEGLDDAHLWHAGEMELIAPVGDGQEQRVWHAPVQVPPPAARLGVISDVDDTIVHTGADTLLQQARVVLLNDARSRVPFKGVGAFYRALQQEGVVRRNPLWYLTSSPWNVYDLFVDFMRIHHIPPGTLVMKALGIAEDQFIKSSHRRHKLGAIREILAACPALPFVLIGDSGQRDPEIYHRAVQDHPGRILAVYIRDVSEGARRREVLAIAEDVHALGVDMLLVPDTVAAAEHAAERGWITGQDVEHVRHDRRHEEQKPPGLGDLYEEIGHATEEWVG